MNKKLYFLGKMFQYHGFFEFKDRSDEPFKKLFCRFSLSSIFNFMQEHDELICVCEYPSKKPIAFFSEKEIDEKRTVTQNVFYDTYETPREKFIFKI